MIFLCVIFLLELSLGSIATPALPPLEGSYSTTIVASFLHRNATMRLHEYFDDVQKMMRLDVHSDGPGQVPAVRVALNDYLSNKHYNFTIWGTAELGRPLTQAPVTGCDTRPLDPTRPFEQMRTTREMFEKISEISPDDLHYEEAGLIRGIRADSWTATDMLHTLPSGRQININVTWYFSKSDWKSWGQTGGQQPLRILVEGAMDPIGPFRNTYDMIDWMSGRPDAALFEMGGLCGAAGLPRLPLPPMPPSFSTVVAGSFLHRNYTLRMQMFIDAAAQRTRIDVHSSAARGEGRGVKVFIRDHAAELQYNLTLSGTDLLGLPLGAAPSLSCNARALQRDSFFANLVNPNKFFELNVTKEDVYYLGDNFEVRGIRAQAWRVNNFEFGESRNIRVTWYFSAPGWTFARQPGQQEPLRLQVEGLHNPFPLPQPPAAVPTYTFHNVYDFVDFMPTVPGAALFALPEVCTGAGAVIPSDDPAAPALPDFPDSFSAVVEASFQRRNATILMREFYDKPLRRTRFDLRRPTGTVVVVRDFALNQHYNFTIPAHMRHAGSGAPWASSHAWPCDSRPISPKFPYMTTKEAFELASTRTDTRYLGDSFVRRGIRCRAWMARGVPYSQPFYNDYTFTLDVTWYFVAPTWGAPAPATPVCIEVAGTEASGRPFFNTYNFLDFQAGVPDPAVFRLPALCTRDTPAPRRLPPLPRSFVATLEASFEHHRYSLRVTQMFDHAHNRARFDVQRPAGAREATVMDFDKNMTYHFELGPDADLDDVRRSAADCNASAMAPNAFAHRFSNTQRLLEIVDAHPHVTYLGPVDPVRGIEAQAWHAAAVPFAAGPSRTMHVNVTWYFSDPQWRFDAADGGGAEEPLRIVVEGEHRLAVCGDEEVLRMLRGSPSPQCQGIAATYPASQPSHALVCECLTTVPEADLLHCQWPAAGEDSVRQARAHCLEEADHADPDHHAADGEGEGHSHEGSYHFRNVYDFVNFVPGVPKAYWFDLPGACRGGALADTPLPALPPSVAATIEATFTAKGYSFRMAEFTDAARGLVRVDRHEDHAHAADGSTEEHRVRVAILDRGAQRLYVYHMNNTETLGATDLPWRAGSCTVQSLKDDGVAAATSGLRRFLSTQVLSDCHADGDRS